MLQHLDSKEHLTKNLKPSFVNLQLTTTPLAVDSAGETPDSEGFEGLQDRPLSKSGV